MDTRMKRTEEQILLCVAALSVVLVAAHTHESSGFSTPLYTYLYTVIRIGVGCLLFLGARAWIESLWASGSTLAVTVAAIAASHIPYVLSVTALDIAVGMPELGLVTGQINEAPRSTALLWELLYLADNHIGVCLLLALPRWLSATATEPADTDITASSEPPPTLLSVIDPPLQGEVLWVEAQEHYVRVTTSTESRLVLARFSDIVRELPDSAGLQVHRSHWVAREAIADLKRSGQNVTLTLSTGDTVPVSRSFRQRVESVLELSSA